MADELPSEIDLAALEALLPPLDEGIITSAYGPESAGDLRDIVGHPPADADADTDSAAA
jgi:hypothetical protein